MIRTETQTDDGELVNEQYVTEFFRGVEAGGVVGERAPDHRLDATGGSRLARSRYAVADDQTSRYAAASGDDFAIHLDDEFARRSACRAGSSTASARWRSPAAPSSRPPASTTPRAVKRLAVRFSAPLFPGETVTTRVWR